MTSAKVDTLRHSASGAWEQAQGEAASAVKKGKRQAGRLLDETGEFVDEAKSRVSNTTANLGKGLIGYAKKNPLTALLLAAVAGAFVFGASGFLRADKDSNGG